tara:strand:- start:7422 stop:7946 length:525 start_codon:yes stop_codon:yes gene_type:complete
MNYKALGKIRRAHGIRGEVFLISFSKRFDWLQGLETLRLVRKVKNEKGDWENIVECYPIKKQKPHKVGYILDLEGVKTRNQAEDLEGAVLELAAEDLKLAKDEFYLYQLEGFTVYHAGQELGKITGFSTNQAQDLLLVSGEKSLEIPYVDAFIVKVDFDNKQVHCHLPEGFLDL